MPAIAKASEEASGSGVGTLTYAGAMVSLLVITLVGGFSVLDVTPLLEERDTPLLGVRALVAGVGISFDSGDFDFSLEALVTLRTYRREVIGGR